MAKLTSRGVKLQIFISAAWSDVLQILTLQFPQVTVETWDASTLDTTGRYRELEIAEFNGSTAANFTGFYDPSLVTQALLETLLATPAKREWRLLLPSTLGFWAFEGLLSSHQPSAGVGQPLTFSGSVLPTGVITFPV